MTEAAVARHFVVLVYPFRHNVTWERRGNKLDTLDRRWNSWWSRKASNDAFNEAVGDTYFFLPYVRRVLFPETAWFDKDAADRVKRSKDFAPSQFDRFVGENWAKYSTQRLSLNDDHLGELRDLQMSWDESTTDIRVDWIDVVLCPMRVGFLAIKIEIEDDEISHAKLSELLYAARFVRPAKQGWKLPSWSVRNVATDARLAGAEFASRDLVDYLLQGLTEVNQRHDQSFASFLDRVRQDGGPSRYTSTNEGEVYGQVFRLYLYAALIENEAADQPSPPFDRRSDRWVYELATATDTGLPAYEPHVRQVKKIEAEHQIVLWNNWRGLALHDNVCFVGFLNESEQTASCEDDARTPFVLGALPHNVESDYFHLFLLVQFQRTWLSMAFADLVREGEQVDRNWKEVNSVWTRFVRFENCYWYVEVTDKPQGSYIYNTFRQALGVHHLYDEMKGQLQTLHDHYDGRVTRRTNMLLTLLAVVGLPISITTGIFGELPITDPAKYGWAFVATTLGLSAFVGALFAAWRRFAPV